MDVKVEGLRGVRADFDKAKGTIAEAADKALQEVGLIMLIDIFGTFHYKAGTSHSRVADNIFKCGTHKFHHHAYYMTRGAELSVISACRHFPKNIFIDITHSVSIIHIQIVNSFHNLG